MSVNRTRFTALLLGASALALPSVAHADAARERALEARLEKLEAQMAAMQAQLAEARGAQAQAIAASAAAAQAGQQAEAATAQAQAATAKLAALEARPAPAAAPTDGFRSGATTIKLGGYLKMVGSHSHFSNGSVATNTLGRDFYLPQTIPTTVGGRSFDSQDFTAKQTRLWLNLETQVAGHVVKGYLESDFQVTASAVQNVTAGGSQRTTNGYTLGLRRAWVQVDRFTFGQDWTTFQNTAALPESTDYVGGAEGTVFVRQPLVRYAAPLSKQVTLALGIENPESALVTAGSATILESGTDRMPDFTARLSYAGKRAELSLAGLVRQVRGESTGSTLVNNVSTAGAVGSGLTATGFGASIAGKVYLDDRKTSDIRFIATYGQDIGRYVGLNFAPDAVYNPATNRLTDVKVLAALASAHLTVAPQLRLNVMGSFQHVTYDQSLAAASLASLNKSAWSAAANLFWSPVRPVDLGIEYRHGSRELVSGASGSLDRVEFAAKYNF